MAKIYSGMISMRNTTISSGEGTDNIVYISYALSNTVLYYKKCLLSWMTKNDGRFDTNEEKMMNT
jgi:hypothetical protein